MDDELRSYLTETFRGLPLVDKREVACLLGPPFPERADTDRSDLRLQALSLAVRVFPNNNSDYIVPLAEKFEKYLRG